MLTLSVIIPAYNEETGIVPVLERVLAVRPRLLEMGIVLECIVVDDGSRDRTATLVSTVPDVRLIRHPRNRGYGAAIKTGFQHAQGAYLAFMDADGTYPPEALPDLCCVALDTHADVVVGSRMMRGSASQMPPVRRLGNFVYAQLLSLIGNTTIRDTASGMRIIRRASLERLYPLPDGLEFTPTMSTRALHENLKVVESPIPYAERIGRSKLSVVRDGVRFTNAIVWTAMMYNPVRILGLLSLAALAVALLIGLYIVALRLTGQTTLAPAQVFALFSAVVLAVVGVNLFSLGAMFNYLVSLFHRQPVRQGLFGRPVFQPSLDHHFGWMGLVLIGASVVMAAVLFWLGLGGWEITRLWLYLLVSACMGITGVELLISWIVMRVLEQLAQREASVRQDLYVDESLEDAYEPRPAPIQTGV